MSRRFVNFEGGRIMFRMKRPVKKPYVFILSTVIVLIIILSTFSINNTHSSVTASETTLNTFVSVTPHPSTALTVSQNSSQNRSLTQALASSQASSPLDAWTLSLTPTITPTPEPKNSLTLLAVGDDLVHIQVIESGLKKDGAYNFDHLFSVLKPDFEAADIAIINQETILGGSEFEYSGYPAFNSPTEIGDAIINAGFDVVLHGTNHAMDMGYKGIKNTLDYWKNHPEITVLGINASEEAQNSIPIIEKNGIKLAMLNYTFSLNGYDLPADKPYLVNLLDKVKMKKDIEKAKKSADFVIVFPHWGTEYLTETDDSQKDLAAFFAEEGVDLVIGTHPHVVEPIEWIASKSGHKMLVYYSLGNYVSYQKEAPRMLGGMAKLTLTKTEGKVAISNAGIIPIITHYENKDDYCYGVYKLNDYTKEQASVHGVLELEKESIFTLEGTWNLANRVLEKWIIE
jgi:poly-gamma-glutamate capsule biosynthesis protein CapA/YwtB (metallophosphatase superfamily)